MNRREAWDRSFEKNLRKVETNRWCGGEPESNFEDRQREQIAQLKARKNLEDQNRQIWDSKHTTGASEGSSMV
jgi:hypothetical protein